MDIQVGDQVVVESRKIGEHRRTGQILEVLKTPGTEHYRVHWDDGHETIFYPSSDATISHGTASL